MEAGLAEVAQPSEGTPVEGSPTPSRNEAGTPEGNRPRRKKRSSSKKKARQSPRGPFSLDVSLPEGRAAAWETIDETDLVARDVSSQRRKGRARSTRGLSERDQRDLDNAIVMLTHHGLAIERALKASSSLEPRVERLETWQTEQIEAEIEDRLEALSSASTSPRDDLNGDTDGAMPSYHHQQGWQEAFREVNDRMGKLTEAFGSYTKYNTRIERLEALVEGLHDPAVLDGSIDRIATRLGVVEMQLKWSERQPPISSKAASDWSKAIGELSARVDALETVAIDDSSAGTSSKPIGRTRFARSIREHDRSIMTAVIELRKEVAAHTKELTELSEAEQRADQHGDALKKSMQTLRADVHKVKQQVASSRRTECSHSANTMAKIEPTGSHAEQDNSAEQLDAIAADITRLCSVEKHLSTLDSRVTTSTAAIAAQMSKLSESYARFTTQSPSSTEPGLESNAILQGLEAQLAEMNERVSALAQGEQLQLEKGEGVSADELQAAVSAEVDSLRDELSDLRDETTDLREQLAEIGDSVSVEAPSNSRSPVHAPERPPGRRYSVSLASGAVDDFVAILEVSETPGERDTHDEEAPPAAKSMRVICPEGVAPGDALYVQTPEGDEITTMVPDGVEPGMEFDVALSQDSESVAGHTHDVEAEAGGEAEARNDTANRSEVIIWMEQHSTSLHKLQHRMDELDGRLTSSEVSVASQSPSSTEPGLESNAILQGLEAQLAEMNERVSALAQGEQLQLEKGEGVSADELQAAVSAEVDSLRDELSDLRDETTDLREQLAEIGDSVSVEAPSNSRSPVHAPERPPGRRYSVSLASGAVDDFVAILEVSETPGERDTHDEEAPPAAKSMRVICPEGVAPGDALYVQTPEGDEITTMVPDGVEPGMEFDVALSQDSESVGCRDQRVEARDERDSEAEEQQKPQPESSADVLIKHDDEADTKAGGETDACNATVDRTGPVWMEKHDKCINELQRRVDELDARLTSSESAVHTQLSDMSMQFAEAAAASESENKDVGSNDSELTRTVTALMESHKAAALHVEELVVRFDAFKVWAESSSSSLQGELESLRKEAAAEATHRSLLAAEVERVQKVAQELSQATPTDHTVCSDSTRALEQRVGDQEAIIASLTELLKESMATLEADRKNVSVIEHSMGTLDGRLVSSTSDLQRRQDDFDVRLRELKQWSEVNSREHTDEVQSLKAMASSVTDLWSQRSESTEMAQRQSEAVQVAMERLRAKFEEAVSKQSSPRPSNMVDAAPTCIMDDPELTEWITAMTTKVTAVEAALHENVATLESEFKQFGQNLSELSQWMQDHLANEKTRAAELETRMTKLSESITSDTGPHQLVADGMSKQATTCTQVVELSARLDSLKRQMSDELSSLREDASDLREETSDIREILASTETTVAPLPPLPKTTASEQPQPASDINQRRYSIAMAPGAAQEAVASLEGDMNQFEDQLATLRALEASLEQREDRMEHNLEIHREELAKQRLLNEDSAESVRFLERRMEEAIKSDAERAKSILETVCSQLSAMEEKMEEKMGEMVELNMEAEEELRADMAKVIKNAEAAVQAAVQDTDEPTTLMDELTTGASTAGTQDTSVPIDVERLILEQILQKDLVSKSEYRAELQEAKHSLSTEIAEQVKDVYAKFANSAEESSVLAKRVSQLAEQIELQGTRDAASDNGGGTSAATAGDAESIGAVDSVAGSATSKLKSFRRKK